MRERGGMLIRQAIGFVPALAPVAAVFLNNMLTPAFARRTVEWSNSLADRVERAEHRLDGFSFDVLASDAEGCDLVL